MILYCKCNIIYEPFQGSFSPPSTSDTAIQQRPIIILGTDNVRPVQESGAQLQVSFKVGKQLPGEDQHTRVDCWIRLGKTLHSHEPVTSCSGTIFTNQEEQRKKYILKTLSPTFTAIQLHLVRWRISIPTWEFGKAS
jgi:hypothetical protein